MGFRYTAEQDEFLRKHVKGTPNIELVKMFNEKFKTNKTVNQLQMRKCKLGIKSGINTGCFKKGHIPDNKGKKMSKEQYEKCKNTMFKKGNVPNNRREILSERVDKRNGGLLVKIQDGHYQQNWIPKGRYVWEQYNGKIPDGYYIMHADGNPQNCEIDNLILVSNAEELIMNRYNLIKNDKELTKVGANIARVMDKVNKLKKVNKNETKIK